MFFFKQSCFLIAILLTAGKGYAELPAPQGPSAAKNYAEESDVLVVGGSLVKIVRKAAWPRIEMLTNTGEPWMLELPPTVTLAWYQGRPQDLDALKPGQWIKVLYTKVGAKKRVRSVQVLPGFREGSAAGQSGAAGGEPPVEPFPKVPTMPLMPKIEIKTPALPVAPKISAPEAPRIPNIPSIDTSRQSRN